MLLVSVWYSAGAEFDYSFPPVVAGSDDDELQFPCPLFLQLLVMSVSHLHNVCL